jgi:peptidoglycan/LPS O-acetylase OafA/YrhL
VNLLKLKNETSKVLRVDIQLLRAFAVLLVVFFHLWPGIAKSGFIGVDVFFVISGYLITSHLLKEAFATSSIKLKHFWARRMRRLLPSALVVIFVTSVFTYLFVPKAFWGEYSLQTVASTLYVENWVLAFNSVDYLHSEQQATAFQQFWSLSVEEQFYIFWPLIIMSMWFATKTKGQSKKTISTVLIIVCFLSLAFSIVLVNLSDATAYFSSLTRAWEFGAGGLVALIALKCSQLYRWLLMIIGSLFLLMSVLIISPETPFPGLAAIPPVLGTVLILISGSNSSRPLIVEQKYLIPAIWLGGISYSIYLWHWPLIILFPFVTGVELTFTTKIILFVSTILLAWISTTFLERPIIRSRKLNRIPPGKTMLVFATIAVLSLLPTGVATAYNLSAVQQENTQRKLQSTDGCFGIRSLEKLTECSSKSWSVLSPAPAIAGQDVSVLYENNHECISDTSELIICSFGEKGSTKRILLVGDSHAAQWFPALDKIAKKNNYQLDVILRFSCVFSSAPRGTDFADCEKWSESLNTYLAKSNSYSLMFASSWASNLAGDVLNGTLTHEEAIEGFHKVWNPLIQRGTSVIVIRDIPELSQSPAMCLEQLPQQMGTCSVPRSEALSISDLQFEAARNYPGVKAIDMTDAFCDEKKCFTMVGGIVVYLDLSHINKTYAGNLTDFLDAKIQRALK